MTKCIQDSASLQGFIGVNSALLASLFLLCGGLLAGCQNHQPANEAAGPSDSIARGATLFASHCAVCHGTDGEGDGPASGSLMISIADLRDISSSNGGVFPETLIYAIIDGRDGPARHYRFGMPVWGDAFTNMGNTETATQAKIDALTQYLKSIQRPE